MIRNICLALAASTALIAGTAQAADFFLRVDGISGTSTVQGFEQYFELESWSMGFTRGMCQNLNFTKIQDAASADLTGATMLGTNYPTILLAARRRAGDGSQFTYLKLTLFNSVFTSFQVGGSNGGGQLPFEQVSLQPSSVVYEAFQQDQSGQPQLVARTNVTCQKVK
jgi:type VI protein secretion system component Hcp